MTAGAIGDVQREPATSALFTPIHIGSMVVKNRNVMPAMILNYPIDAYTLAPEWCEFYSRAARGGASLEHALPLEGSQVIECCTRGDLEALADLADSRRQSVLGDEPSNEAEHLLLLARELSHSQRLQGDTILNGC